VARSQIVTAVPVAAPGAGTRKVRPPPIARGKVLRKLEAKACATLAGGAKTTRQRLRARQGRQGFSRNTWPSVGDAKPHALRLSLDLQRD
jgi:hypothetical protein